MVGARQFDEEEVIAIALDVFRRKGLHDATMQDLATATGVQRGSLYNAYGDKETIFLRAFDQYASQFLELSRKAFEQGGSIAARLHNFLLFIIVNMTSGSPQQGCFTTRTALDMGISSDAVRARVQAILSGLEQIIAKEMAAGSSKLQPAEAVQLARVIVTFTRGLAVMERVGYSRKQLKEAAATFVEAILRKG